MVKVRISVLIAFIITLILAGYLGFSSIQLIHDKLIHFIIFCILTIEFYFIFDTQFKSLKLVRYLTFFICTIGGSISSEIIQNLINKDRIFDPIDILSNVLGSLLGLILSILYQNYRKSLAKKERLKYHKLMNNSSNGVEENAVLNDQEDELDLGNSGRTTPSDYVNIQLKDV
ncbi:hypothetical protein KGF54_002306 [Candida jiufengensis]|uniref:uncharacterized protein n=1 Tax=Candida jiufengensis TaxID=497108 RepID=UPI002225574D|nr:uncharacterized protein KGF54_002306 [Candida jiufengensis]KAI5954531.1 hypothetical protein KGF54_002306 [Candida jiufengensis]